MAGRARSPRPVSLPSCGRRGEEEGDGDGDLLLLKFQFSDPEEGLFHMKENENAALGENRLRNLFQVLQF